MFFPVWSIGQPFAYVIVIDFEATCWKEKKLFNYAPEISVWLLTFNIHNCFMQPAFIFQS